MTLKDMNKKPETDINEIQYMTAKQKLEYIKEHGHHVDPHELMKHLKRINFGKIEEVGTKKNNSFRKPSVFCSAFFLPPPPPKSRTRTQMYI